MNNQLYKFSELDQQLDDLGFPKLEKRSGYEAIRTDFKTAYEAGKIEFRDDGIYLIDNGKEWKGYMYMPTYRVAKYGQVSRFHLTRCSVIDDFITSGMFKTYYKWSNNQYNDIIDRDTKEIYENQKLQLCSKCREAIFDEINDTEDFYNTLDNDEIEDENIEIDIFGYERDWQKISKNYRKSQDYTCEHCNIQISNPSDRRYIHTHHINGDKTNNNNSNLECLCVLCHSYKDIRHEENFDKKRMHKEVKSFVEKYRDELIESNNPYLNRFENENKH